MPIPVKESEGSCSTSTSVAGRGHCIVYSADGLRFEAPLAYLGTVVFGELLMLSEEEFGFESECGKITLPCDATVMEYVMCLLRRDASEEVVRAFLSSMARPCHTVSGVAPWNRNQRLASCSTSTSVAGKGHCIVYSADGQRFEVPLVYLGTVVFCELLMLSQEEFGFTSDDGKIMLPCDAAVMEYVMCLLRRDASKEVVRAFLSSMVRPCHTVSGVAPWSQRLAVCV